ncbi:MAG: hypothetical protein MZV70_13800 [Desulfobacterales bacterium]|nr:hypothetical protein [Desulfobacterales bacterium]
MLIPENVLVTTNYVLVETFALDSAQTRHGRGQGIRYGRCALLNVEWVTPAMHRSGISALLAASRAPSEPGRLHKFRGHAQLWE